MPTSKLLLGLHPVSSSPNLTAVLRPQQPPPVNRPWTEQEREAIAALRQVVPQCARFDDAYLLRWLRSKEGRFDETADGLKKNVVFRKAWDLDRIERWTAPEILEKHCGYGFLSDREGNPILMSLLGNMDVEGMVRSVQSKDYIKFSLAAIEKGIELCNQRAAQTGRPFEQMMLVFDLDHISNAHFSSKQFASSFTTLVLLFQEHYPLVLKKILIIRAPEMARIAFKSMTPFLSEPIQNLIEMPSEECWQSALNSYVDLDSWPVHWGGRLEENGDPKCPSKIRYGYGPVPDTYFVDPANAMPDYDSLTTVYAGTFIELKVKKGTRICWQYMTEEDDIGFADLLRQERLQFEQPDRSGARVPVHPAGVLVCPHLGLADLRAGRPIHHGVCCDNGFSWFSPKQLRYNIEIEEPMAPRKESKKAVEKTAISA
ncbi:SEC14-like protein 2 [Aphelenchoides fujianensis]|nr:SEC14-like protein 2 [Aphelenchoides fujianensis]